MAYHNVSCYIAYYVSLERLEQIRPGMVIRHDKHGVLLRYTTILCYIMK